MKPQEGINRIKDVLSSDYYHDESLGYQLTSDDFEWLEEAKKALEKQIPKHFEIWNGQCSCPNCNKLFGNYSQLKTLIHWEMPHCKYCGQALDWSETEKGGVQE